MGEYLLSIWRARHFWLSLVAMDLQTRYRRSVLGIGWSLLQPIVLTVILYSVFHPMFQVENYALKVLAGLVCWNFITSVTLQGSHCFLVAEGYIRQHPSPLAIYPLRAALGGMVHFLLALLVVLGATWLLCGFHNPLALLSLIPAVFLVFLLGWGVAVLAGVFNVLFRDTEHLLQVAFQLLFYATPIIYPPDLLQTHRLGWLTYLNPFTAFIHLIREPILDGQCPAFATFAAAGCTVMLLLGASALVLQRLQRRLIFLL